MQHNILFFAITLVSIHAAFAQERVDSTFGTNGIVITDFNTRNDRGTAIAIQPDGKIIVAGYSNDSLSYGIALARYNTDGSPDNSFDGDGKLFIDMGADTVVTAMVGVTDNGKIVVGACQQLEEDPDEIMLFKFNADGTPDNGFNTNGQRKSLIMYSTIFANTPATLIVQPDRKILLAGTTINGDFTIMRYNSNGTVDNTFSTTGMRETVIGESGSATATARYIDGSIIAGGYAIVDTQWQMVLVRYSASGIPDSSFGTNGVIIEDFDSFESVTSLALQSDGKIVATISTGGANLLARFQINGGIDPTFGTDGLTLLPGEEMKSPIAIAEDGKILVATSFNNGIDSIILLRYYRDGTPDNTFGINGRIITSAGDYSESLAIALQDDDKILVAGYSNNGTDDDFILVRYINELSVGIRDLSTLESNMLVYPNPVAENAVFKFELPEKANVNLSLYSADGREVHEYINSEQFSQGAHQVVLDFPSQLAPGFYLLRLQTSAGNAEVKILRQ